MTSNDIFQDSRLLHVRELKAEVSRLKEELSMANAELESLRSHFALALLAATDAQKLGEDGSFLIIDGWNVMLNSSLRTKENLIARVHERSKTNPGEFTWIVLDGSKENSFTEERLRVSYTGGRGEHRADKMIVDFLHMLRLSGSTHPVTLVTNDEDFAKAATRHKANVISVNDFAKPCPSSTI